MEIKGAHVNNTSEEEIEAVLDEINNTVSYQKAGGGQILDTLATFIGGGYENTINDPGLDLTYKSLASSIIGGGKNSIEGRFSLIGNGYLNDCKDNFSAIVAGYNNKMKKEEDNQGSNFIGAGQSNIIDGGTNQAIIAGQGNEIIYDL